MTTTDFFLKTTHQNGRVSITSHRVWDRNRFMAAQRNLQDKAKPEDRCEVSETTEAEYRGANWGRRQ